MQDENRNDGGGRPPGRRGAKLCGKCGKLHWGAFERNGTFYGRAWDPVAKRVRTRKAGTHALALKVAAKLATEIAEGRHFPKPAVVWDPPFAEFLDDYVNRTGVIDRDGAERFVRYWKQAPETKGKTMREILRRDARAYRARRRLEGAPGARRKRGAGSGSTLNKELSFARGAYYDFIAQVEERNEEAHLKGRASEPVPANPFASSRSQHRRRQERLYEPEDFTRDRHLGEREVEPLFAALDLDAKRKVLAAVLSGVDRGEMFAWTWDDNIDWDAREIRGWRRKGDGTLREYRVPMADLERVLRSIHAEQVARWGKPSRWVWPNAANSGPADAREFVRTVFKPALFTAGILRLIETKETKQVKCRLWQGRRHVPGFRTVEKIRRRVEGSFRWKDLRHTFATWLRRKGEGLDLIGELLGHAKGSKMTTRYAHIGADMKHAAVGGLSGLVPAFVTEAGTETSLSKADTPPTVH